jgi:sulfur carrier protein
VASLIQLNGKPTEIPDPLTTILDIVRHFGLTPSGLIAEHNGTLVQSADFESALVQTDDVLELIQFMGGGEVTLTSASMVSSPANQSTYELGAISTHYHFPMEAFL